ncbi:hypothetical protein AOQ71_02650 [Bradyrhizobium manausense]|uniref:Uncharacterized protein n=2 Tax=Bradyrhizobium manausense TaxID=989370 RepID=A0A0R3E9J3_9BRAD|nr:hypothetical protein AOQ71_02650 [Bradyrhizobium manausense]
MFATSGNSVAANGLLSARIVASFDFRGKVRFCYDHDPAIIHFEYDKEKNLTDIRSRSINGDVRTIFQFTGTGDERSLSCSQDGSTIAALDGDRQRLFVLRDAQASIYRFGVPLVYSVIGKYSLLSPDGSTIGVPGVPVHVSGPDVLSRMRLFPPDKSKDVFFEDGEAYVDEAGSIDVYSYSDGWKKKRSMRKPGEYFYVREVARCGSRTVISLSDDKRSRFGTLDENLSGRADWLARIGVRNLLATFSDVVSIDGGYGRCVFPLLRKHDVRGVLQEIVSFGDDGVRRFKIEGAPLAMSDDEIRLSKDGCYALFGAFKRIPEVPQFTMPQQAVVLRFDVPDCKQQRTFGDLSMSYNYPGFTVASPLPCAVVKVKYRISCRGGLRCETRWSSIII